MKVFSIATALLGIVAACNSLGKLCIRPILKRLSQTSANATFAPSSEKSYRPSFQGQASVRRISRRKVRSEACAVPSVRGLLQD
jgi:hypothetical protein